jgi:hypothetical protein
LFDVVMTIVCLAVVFSLAAGVLFVVDRLSLKSDLSEEQRRAFVAKRTERWQRRYGLFTLIMAVAALLANAFNLGHDSIGWRIGWSAAAALVVIFFLLSKQKQNGKNEDSE